MSRQEECREAKRAYWRSVLADWARSGLSKTEYARRHELNYGQLRWWSS
ncbi:IS66 family insertion sequence element accessory protein TnpA, partial [Halorhodospira halophila]